MQTVVIVGGGPTGLYYGILHKKQYPDDRVIVFDRNASNSTFGWGVVFSDATVENIKNADTVSAANINDELNHWQDIETWYKGSSSLSTGHGFIGIKRLRLLNILHQRCEQLGVEMHFSHEVDDEMKIAEDYQADMIIASDGIHSTIRRKYDSEFRTDIDTRKCRFTWLGTKKLFDAFTFIFEETEHGWVSVHAYRFNSDTSTFIVEMREETWRKTGIDKMDQKQSIAWCEQLFANYLDGHSLVSNASHLRGSASWMAFPRVICSQWHSWQNLSNGKPVPIVLMGDSSHTAHFSIGSGTKLGFEDAITFSNLLKKYDNVHLAIEEYERVRRVEVARLQGAAKNSTWWFENVALHQSLDPHTFYYALLTRSLRITHNNLRLRDPHYIARFEQECCDGGLPGKQAWNLQGHATNIQLPARSVLELRGAINYDNLADKIAEYQPAMLISNSFDVSLKTDVFPSHASALARQCHESNSLCAISLYQPQGNLLAGLLQAPDESLLEQIKRKFIDHALQAEQLAADALELNLADGGLLSQLMSALTNRGHGRLSGDLLQRCQYISQIFLGIKEAVQLPLLVRICAYDYHRAGNQIEDGVAIARLFAQLGAAAIGVSSGRILADTQIHKGRVYNGLFADEIRNSPLMCEHTDTAIICTGSIDSLDQVDTCVASGRADLVAIDGLKLTIDRPE